MRTLMGMLAVAAVLALAASAQATTMIGANFIGDGSGSSLASADDAGVIPQFNWNNLAGASGNGVALGDNTGSPTTATVTWNSWGTYSIKTDHGEYDPNTPLKKLMNGFVYSYETGGKPITVTVDGIPAGYQGNGYDVYIYVHPNNDVFTAKITAGGTDYYSKGQLYPDHIAYTQVTSTDPDNPTMYGSYVYVTGQHTSSFSFTVTQQYVTPGCFGFQLVQNIPEPATMGLLALGGVGMVALRRRR